MCGIIAFKTKKKTPEHVDILLKLIKESKIRGLHSFGYSYIDKGIKTARYFTLPTNLDNFLSSNSNEFIFHNRYCTSGDWTNPSNNQPITFGGLSIAMNGVISMKPKEEYEKEYKIKCETENDSEIFLKLLVKEGNPEKVIRDIKGSCAVVWLNDKKEVFATRNEYRPLHYFKHEGAIFVCSTADIAYRAIGVRTEEIPAYSMLRLNDHA